VENAVVMSLSLYSFFLSSSAAFCFFFLAVKTFFHSSGWIDAFSVGLIVDERLPDNVFACPREFIVIRALLASEVLPRPLPCSGEYGNNWHVDVVSHRIEKTLDNAAFVDTANSGEDAKQPS
jgi:hypothetical protein